MDLNRERAGEPTEVELLAPDLVRVPLRTFTIPPATRTNSFLLRGRARWWVVDLGAADEAELARLEEELRVRCGGWDRVGGLLLTHAHADHVAGVPWWRAKTDAPVYASRLCAAALAERGEAGVQELGEDAPPSRDGIAVIETPGHARGHRAFMTPSGHVACGDLIAGVGTVIIDPPDGDMSAYLASLERVAALAPTGLHPAHGPSAADPVERLRAFHAHRLAREARVDGALSALPRDLAIITARAYADVPVALHAFAARSCLAHLLRLEGLGRAERETEGGPWARSEEV